MFAYRVEKRKYVKTILKGIPGEVSDFRWNTKGNPIIYCSESRSLALHEKSANMSKPFYGLSPSFVLVEIEIPDGNYQNILPENLSKGWDLVGSYHRQTQKIGDDFTFSQELVLRVPSAIVKGEFNILINPKIARELQLKINIEEIDHRLIDLR